MKQLQPDELEDELFLAMLNMGRRGAGPEFDLLAICEASGIKANPHQLLAFTSDNDGIFGVKSVTMNSIRFTLNAEGRRHAKAIEESRRKPTFFERLKTLPVGKGSWDVFKIGLGVILGIVATKYFG